MGRAGRVEARQHHCFQDPHHYTATATKPHVTGYVPDDRLTREAGDQYAFLAKVGGVVPGYGGHRPGADRVCFKSGYGGVPRPSGSSYGGTPP